MGTRCNFDLGNTEIWQIRSIENNAQECIIAFFLHDGGGFFQIYRREVGIDLSIDDEQLIDFLADV